MRFDVRSRSPTLVKASTAYIRGYLRSFGAHIRVEHRVSADRKEMPNSPSATDLTNAAWELIAAVLPAALPGSRPCTTDIRAVLTAIFYLLRTGCQWRLLPRDFSVWGTVYHYSAIGGTRVCGHAFGKPSTSGCGTGQSDFVPVGCHHG